VSRTPGGQRAPGRDGASRLDAQGPPLNDMPMVIKAVARRFGAPTRQSARRSNYGRNIWEPAAEAVG